MDTYDVLSAGRAHWDGRFTVNTVDPDFDIDSSVEFDDRTESDRLFDLTIVEFDDDAMDEAARWLRGRGIL